jgi:hypothetical protein
MAPDVKRDCIVDMMGQYYDTPSRRPVSPQISPATPDICCQDFIHLNRMGLRVLQDKLKREIVATQDARTDILYRQFMLLSSDMSRNEMIDFLNDSGSADLAHNLERAINNETRIMESIANNLTTSRSTAEISAAHEVFKLLELCDDLLAPKDAPDTEQLESVKTIKTVLLDCPSSLRSYPLIEKSLRKLEDHVLNLFRITVERIEVNFEDFTHRESDILRELMSTGLCDTAMISGAAYRLLLAREKLAITKLDANVEDTERCLQIACDMCTDSLDGLYWTFPNEGIMIDEHEERLRLKIIPSWIIRYMPVDIAEFIRLSQRFTKVLSSVTDPSLNEFTRTCMRTAIFPIVNKHKDYSQQETLNLLGSTCADLLTVRPGEAMVLLFESVTLEILLQVASRRDTTRDSIRSLIELRKQFQLRTIPNLLRMVSVEMIADLDDRNLDTRLEQLLSQLE